MVTEWFAQVGVAIATFFVELLPAWSPPVELVQLDETVNGWLASLGGLSPWVPWPVVILSVVLAVGTWAAALSVKAIRAVASYLPFIGGAG